MKKGYARVSSKDQNLARQLKVLKEQGCEVVYQEKISGKNTNRPELQRMLNELEEGDVIIIAELSRFSRSTMDLFNLIEQLKEKKVALKSLKEEWLDTSKTDPGTTLMLTIFAALVQFERELIKERQKEGIAIAKEKGLYNGRPKKYGSKHQGMTHAIQLAQERDKTINEICNITQVSRAALYRELKKLNEQY